MALSGIPDPPGFAELPKTEQIEYLQRLWDGIAADEAAVPAPESHLALAAARLAAYRARPEAAEPAHALLDRLGRKHR
jgi:putative addiction module component (TIGR02574 family)